MMTSEEEGYRLRTPVRDRLSLFIEMMYFYEGDIVTISIWQMRN